ncbi:hypothetical protein HHK36_018930 [Tetracentron sinense]|uniref:Uncharacterized protein n=1 Tax=Tetracentron sinense TaxID=13715 RepID=A0A834YYF9_TETSI|nr:hypothetical protein HHK36_018930 [Tetracentron sinense]
MVLDVKGVPRNFLLCKERTRRTTMISLLAQERLLGAALGSIFTGIIVFEQRKSIYSLIPENPHPEADSQIREPIFGKKSRSEFAHLWNKAVDQTLGPVIVSLSSRRW